MAEVSWPFDDQDTTESQYGTLLGQAIDTGVADGLAPYGDASGMFVKVTAGLAFVRGFVYRSDATVTLAVQPATTVARTDRVVVRLDLPGNRATLAVRTGDGTTGAAAALTQASGGVWEMPVGTVTVPANATTVAAANVTADGTYASEAWGRWTTANRPPAPRFGKAGFNATLKAPEVWDGTGWRPFGSPSTDASALTSGTLSRDRLESYDVLRSARDNRFDAPLAAGDPGVVDGDWNRVLSVGMFRTSPSYQNSNAPAGAVLYGTLVVFGAGPSISSRTQMYFANTGGLYWRTAWSGNDWGSWQTASSGGTATVAKTATYQGGFGPGSNGASVRLSQTGTTVTLGFNIKASQTVSSGVAVLKVDDAVKPSLMPWDFPAKNSQDATVWCALDLDGYVRVRSGTVTAGSGLFGTVTYLL